LLADAVLLKGGVGATSHVGSSLYGVRLVTEMGSTISTWYIEGIVYDGDVLFTKQVFDIEQ